VARKGVTRPCPVCVRPVCVVWQTEKVWPHIDRRVGKRCEGSGRRVALW
jgi:hypothetical protein